MFKRGRVFSTTPAEFCVEKYKLLLLLGLHPKPALLFSLQKSKQKASPLGTYKTYFEPGVLQLPTVGQIKRLYNSVQNRFYKQVQKGALNGNGKQQKTKARRKTALCFLPWRASTRVIVRRLFFQICAVWAGLSLGAVWLYATLAQRDRPDGQMWKNVAHQTQTRGKMLFFPLCVNL